MVGHKVVKLEEISLADDSGWRELDAERVSELCEVIKGGSYGATSLMGPSLVQQDNKMVLSATDGRFVIYNGKHFISALLRCQELAGVGVSTPATGVGVSALAATDGPTTAEGQMEWLTDQLVDVFTQGLSVALFEFPDGYSNLRHRSIQALSHEEEHNKLYHTTLAQKARIVREYYFREKNDWDKAQKALTAELGQQKARTVHRWTILAQHFSENVLKSLGDFGLKNLPQGHVVNNKYLVGRGAEAKCRLTDEWAKVALRWFADAGAALSSDVFMHEYCLPAKHAETWVRAQERSFGVVATGFRAFTRCVERLKSEAGRRNIMTWLHLQVNPKPPNFGLPEIQAVVDEMARTRAGGKPGVDPDDSVGVTTDGPVGVTTGADESDNRRGDDEGVSVDMLVEDEPVMADPVIIKAQELALADMALISTHTPIQPHGPTRSLPPSTLRVSQSSWSSARHLGNPPCSQCSTISRRSRVALPTA